jgi:hypothetical protein
MARPDEVVWSVDPDTQEATPLRESDLESFGIWERRDLQRWIVERPEIIEPDLLVVTSEFDRWQGSDRKVLDRLDVLFLDSDGAPLIAELKRGEAPDTTDLQVIKYASYCAQMTVEEVVEEYGRTAGVTLDEARAAVLDHAPALATRELGRIRIRLVAERFGPSVTNTVMWLRDYGVEIGCIEVRARVGANGHAIISSRQLLPPPAAEDYLVKRRRREVEEETREATSRRRNTVTILLEADALPAGQELTLRTSYFNEAMREKLEAAIGEDPGTGQAEWTGISLRQAIRWKRDGKVYSCSGLIEKLLAELGFPGTSVAGPEYWLVDGETTLFDKSLEIEPQRGASNEKP